MHFNADIDDGYVYQPSQTMGQRFYPNQMATGHAKMLAKQQIHYKHNYSVEQESHEVRTKPKRIQSAKPMQSNTRNNVNVVSTGCGISRAARLQKQ